MVETVTAQAGTALSPEWDRGFDEAFTELVTGDIDLVNGEFDAIIDANFDDPPTHSPECDAQPPPRPDGNRSGPPARAADRSVDGRAADERPPP